MDANQYKGPERLEWIDKLIDTNNQNSLEKVLDTYLESPNYQAFYHRYLKRKSYRLFPLVKDRIKNSMYNSEEEYFRLLSFALWHSPVWALPIWLDSKWSKTENISRVHNKISSLDWTNKKLQDIAIDYWVNKKSPHIQPVLENLLKKNGLEHILIEKIVQNIQSGADSTPDQLSLLEKNSDALLSVLPYLRVQALKFIESANFYVPIFHYINYNLEENRELRPNFTTLYYLFEFYNNNYFGVGPENINSFDFYSGIVLKVLNHMPLNELENEELNRQLYSADCNYTKSQYRISFRRIQMCEFIGSDQACRTLYLIHLSIKSFSNAAMDALKNLHSDYYFRDQISELLTNERLGEKEQRQILNSLFATFPDKEQTIRSLLQSCGSEQLASLISHNPLVKDISPMAVNLEPSFEHFIVSENILLPDLLQKHLNQMNPRKVVIATGFFHINGATSLFDVINKLLPTCEVVFLIGALQNYNRGIVKKMDAGSAVYLNSLIDKPNFHLLTDEHEFYHGKLYWIENESEVMFTVGSSNVSKTAFYLNRELDLCIKCSKDSSLANQFGEWLRNMINRCTQLTKLDTTKFKETYSDEQFFNECTGLGEKQLSLSDLRKKIEQLTDEQQKIRLNSWLSFNPEEIYVNTLVEAFSNYIILVYKEKALIVFESFDANNAYYAFESSNLEKLREEIKFLSKREICKMNNCSRGYHLGKSSEEFIEQIEELFL